MKYTQQELIKLLNYNPLTGTLLWRSRPPEMFQNNRIYKSWNTRYSNKPAFTAINRYGYYVGAIDNVVYQASRIIFKLIYGIEPDQVDHIDGNTLNNRSNNLRNVSHTQNQRNTKKRSNNTSGVVGVCWDKSKNRWKASIGIEGKSYLIGRYKTLKKAKNARKNREIEQKYHSNHGR